MDLKEAPVVDILRCNQRDQVFISDLESQLHTFLRYLSGNSYHKLRKCVPILANVWYYYMTSLGNLQTLGEEYAGIIRFTKQNRAPSNLLQLIWMLLYIGGEPIIDRASNYAENQIRKSPSLTQEAKDLLLKCIECFKENKVILRRIHHSIFYVNGKYYNISNRFTKIKYVLLRKWMHSDAYSKSFKLLGELSLFYILFNIVQTILSKDLNTATGSVLTSAKQTIESSKSCIICGESIKNPTMTPCGHIFCWECLCESLSYQKSCPMCREEVYPNRIIFLQNYV